MLYTREKVIKNKIPNSLAIILDGNGRWAKKRGLPRNIGHYMGAKNLVEITKECNSLGIKSLIVYAFSTENWKRPKEEVDYIFGLIEDYLKDNKQKFVTNDIKLNHNRIVVNNSINIEI